MATYTELHALRGAGTTETLRQKILVALAIKANTIAKLPTPTVAQKDFAIAALRDPESYLPLVLNYVLAENNAATTVAITSASDSLVQTAVNAAVDTLLGV
jgi:hypothetical protein